MEENSKESEALLCQDKAIEGRWERKDYILLVLGLLISFGVGIEIHLPGNP